LKLTFYICLFICYLVSHNVSGKPTVEDYGRLAAISKPALSPDGSMVAFRKTDGDKDLLVVYSLKDHKPLKMVDLGEINPRAIYFVSDNYLVIRIEERKYRVGTGREYDHSAAFVLDMKEGTVEQLLTPGDRIYTEQTHVGSIVGLSKDKKNVFMPAYIDPNRDPAAALSISSGPFYYALMKVDLSSPNGPRRIEKGREHTIDYFMGPDGDALVMETYNEFTTEHRILVKRKKKWKTIYEKKEELLEFSAVGLTPDYKSLVITTYPDSKSRLQYMTMSLKDGSTHPSDVNREDRGVGGVLDDINRIVHGIYYTGFTPEYKMFNSKADKLVKMAQSKFPNNSVFVRDWTNDWDKLLILVSGSNAAGEYYLINSKGDLTALSSEYPAIKPEDVHPIASVNVKARDGLVIPTLITIPREHVANMKNIPVVMFPHGGPEAYDRLAFDWMAQALANEGYMVIQPQFRGSSGFGRAHIEAGYGEWGMKMQDDITDTLSFFVKQGIADPNKACIVGMSYGGYAALAGGAFTPELYQCIVSINGVSDVPAFINNKEYDHGRYSSVIRYFNENIANETGQRALAAISPAKHPENFTSPVLLIHSEDDRNVRIDQSKRMLSSLKSAEKAVEFIKLKDENHSLDTTDSRMTTVKAVVSFVNKYLKSAE